MSLANTSVKNFVAALIAAIIGTFLAFPAAAALKVGDPLPDLQSFQLEGKLPDKLQGHVILLDFWASWCTPCKASFPVMEELHKQFASRGLVILAVNEDEKREAMEKFLKQVTVSFHVVRDQAQKLVAEADAATMPSSFLIDRKGKVRFVHKGFRGATTRKEYLKEIEQLLNEPAP